MNTIYEPKGRAREYGDLALNIYTGCPHGCAYCFAPQVLKKDRATFHQNVEPRQNIASETKKLLDKGYLNVTDHVYRGTLKCPVKRTIELKGKLIHLCFSCDPYPDGYDTEATREIIKAIKWSGNHVQILTKNGAAAKRDFDLLDENDWFGVTYTGLDYPNTIEPDAANYSLDALSLAHSMGISTWISCEPVLRTPKILIAIELCDFIDKWKIGKLNYHKPEDFGLDPINWAEFGRECERLCKERGRNYYIKEDLRKAMKE